MLFLRTIEVPRGGALSIDLFSLAGPRRFWVVALVGVGLGFLWQSRRARRLSVFLILLLVGGCRWEPRQDSASDAGAQIVGDTKVEIIQPADQDILLGLSERDLTGDRKAEILRVTGVGRTIDELEADFTISPPKRPYTGSSCNH